MDANSSNVASQTFVELPTPSDHWLRKLRVSWWQLWENVVPCVDGLVQEQFREFNRSKLRFPSHVNAGASARHCQLPELAMAILGRIACRRCTTPVLPGFLG